LVNGEFGTETKRTWGQVPKKNLHGGRKRRQRKHGVSQTVEKKEENRSLLPSTGGEKRKGVFKLGRRSGRNPWPGKPGEKKKKKGAGRRDLGKILWAKLGGDCGQVRRGKKDQEKKGHPILQKKRGHQKGRGKID